MFELRNEVVEVEARLAAGWFAERGVVPGDRIVVAARNRPDYVSFTLGALRRGIIPVLLNVHQPSEEQWRLVADAEASLVLSDNNWPDLSEARPVDIAPHPLARPMHYTSGTTGVAKGVWSGGLSAGDAAALTRDEAALWDAQPGDTYLVSSPLYHSAPHRIAISALLAGARVLLFEGFDRELLTDAFASKGVSGAFLVPTHLRRLLEGGFYAPEARRILHAGEPCPESLKHRAIDAFGIDNLYEFYGSTEGQFTLCSSQEWLERPGTVGRARTGRRLAIEDADANGVGLVYVTAPSFSRWTYWRDAEKTADAWRDDAFTVGDLGRLDADGYLYLEGRREDLIISGGVNVYPAEVERVLLTHPGIAEVAVFGVADDEWGQRVCAAIVGDVHPDEVRFFARSRLPGSHVPKDIVAVDVLPRTNTGKLKRAALAASQTDA